ncbi:hypothetical protein WBJ53_06320 [Spirosoma sp. SC4-14]|uniref:hypothetical protein n=1 Tax=Spirosoma sp. SC4-14 TaxID=3128900 RepID=UPI0030D353CC
MAINQHAANLVDITVGAFNGDVTSISPMDGISLIDSWITTLRNGKRTENEPNTISVANGLSELKAELQSGNPNGWHIRGILENLINQVKHTSGLAESDVKTKLLPLIESLEDFCQQLGGSPAPARKSERAPMTSTVGGESTTGSVGTSALGDTIGNDGSIQNTVPMGDDYTPGSGTRSSGVSSGTMPDHATRSQSGNTDTGSSGGRSQY